jgi:hypothetical protein
LPLRPNSSLSFDVGVHGKEKSNHNITQLLLQDLALEGDDDEVILRQDEEAKGISMEF